MAFIAVDIKSCDWIAIAHFSQIAKSQHLKSIYLTAVQFDVQQQQKKNYFVFELQINFAAPLPFLPRNFTENSKT